MKKILSLAAMCCLLLGAAHAQKNYRVVESSNSSVEVTFSTNSLQVNGVQYAGHDFSSLTMEGFVSLSEVGKPALPTLVKLVEMPLGSGLSYEIVSYVCDTLDGSDLQLKSAVMPAQPSRSKSDIRPEILHQDAAVYASQQFWGHDVISVEKVGVARDANLAEVHFCPVKWNPATNQVIVYKNVTVRIYMEQPDMAATLEMKQLHHSGAFGLSADVINTLPASKAVSSSAPIRYLIVAHSSFRNKFDSFVAWKKRQGLLVDVAYTDDSNVGSDSASIRSYIRSQYTNATASNPAPTYVLIIGDNEQIPGYVCTTGSGWSASTHYSDLYYMCWNAGDNIPDCYYGRFSAQNVNQLTPQVEKTLLYEQYAFTDPSYLSTSILIAGEDQGMSGDNAYTYADPAMDYIAKYYVNGANGFNTVYYYKNNTAFAPTGVTVTGSSQNSSTETALKTLYNSGAGWVNYSAHGSWDSWSIPEMSVSDVSNMTNNGKPQIMIGNCCLTNSFQQTECFGEALLRKGNNAGAVAYFGGSDYTYWSEDFYWSVGVRSNISNTMNATYNASNLGMYDRLFHLNGEAHSDWNVTAGSLNMSGNLAVQSSSSSLKKYYWEVYHLMGDPSLIPWLGQASVMTVNANPSTLMVGSNSLSVNAVPYAYVALTDPNHDLKAAAFADANGSATLNFDMISAPGDYELAVTAQGYQPYFQTISAIVADGPFLAIDSVSLVGTPVAGDTISFNVYLTNIGNESVSEYSIEFITNGDHLFTLQGGQDTLHNTIAGNDSYMLNAGSALIWDNVKDQTSTEVNVIVRWGTHNTEMARYNKNFTIVAPHVKAVNHQVGNLVAGQNVNLTVNNKNMGHYKAQQVQATLISIDPAITVNTAQQTTSQLAANATWNASYSLTLSNNLPTSGIVKLFQLVSYDGIQTVDTIELAFGQGAMEDFESGDLNSFDWSNNNYPWSVTSSEKYAGSYSAKSHDFSNTNNVTSELSITWTSSIDDSLTFYHKVSSESNYDFFRFYIDDAKMEQSSGPNNGWERSAYFITAGTHTFTFSYEKDYSQSNGSDCAWIDNIHFPLSGTSRVYILDSICEGESYQFNDSVISGLTAGNYLFQHNGDHVAYFLQLTVSAAPEVSITASATNVRSGEPVLLQGHGAQNYIWSSGERQPILRAYPRATTTYSVQGYNGGCSSTAEVTINVNGSVAIDRVDNVAVKVYPNPTTKLLGISCNDMVEVAVYNTLGQMVKAEKVNTNQTLLNVDNLERGVYMLQVRLADGNTATQKFVKK